MRNSIAGGSGGSGGSANLHASSGPAWLMVWVTQVLQAGAAGISRKSGCGGGKMFEIRHQEVLGALQLTPSWHSGGTNVAQWITLRCIGTASVPQQCGLWCRRQLLMLQQHTTFERSQSSWLH
jgi:hypothetical protein